MYWQDHTESWAHITEFMTPILDLLDFNDLLFIATGEPTAVAPTGGTHTCDGDFNPGPPTITHINAGANPKDAAYCFAHHDGFIWKACSDTALPYGSAVIGSRTGLSGAWGATPHVVGDPRTPITKLISHGGKLFAVKAEGLFEISYPDGYPTGAAEASSNLVHDFRTDRTGRNFLLDWHSGLYFPGTGGIFEWKSSVLRDMWRERFTPDEAEAPAWPVYDAQKGYFRMATATTRGLVFGSFSPFLPSRLAADLDATWPEEPDEIAQVWFYDGQWFHPLMAHTNPCCEQLYAAILEDRGEGYGWLWYAVGPDIYHVEWPNWTQDRAGDERSEFEYDGRCFWVMPEFDDERPDLEKDWHEVRIRSAALGSASASGESGTLYLYAAYDDGEMGTMGDTNESPMGIVPFPAGSQSYKIQLAALMDPGHGTGKLNLTQKIYACDLIYQPLPETITQHQVWIKLVKHTKRHRGAPDARGPLEQWEELSGLLELTEPFVYNDAMGVGHCVRAGGVTLNEIRQVETPSDEGTGMQVEAVALVTMLEVAQACP
jgi:hypothetical protein